MIVFERGVSHGHTAHLPRAPEHPQAAIVRGAALSGLHDIQPTSRLSRRHYGFAYIDTFDPLRHRPCDRIRSKWTGQYGGHGNLKWKLAKASCTSDLQVI